MTPDELHKLAYYNRDAAKGRTVLVMPFFHEGRFCTPLTQHGRIEMVPAISCSSGA